MEEQEIAGKTYRIGRLDTFKQFHVARRIAPIFAGLGQGAQKALAEKGGAELNEADMAAVFAPVTNILAEMSDEHAEYVIKTCLDVCQRKQDSGAWARVTTKAGELMFQDIDMGVMMQLTMAVIQENNLGSFFPVSPSESNAQVQP